MERLSMESVLSYAIEGAGNMIVRRKHLSAQAYAKGDYAKSEEHDAKAFELRENIWIMRDMLKEAEGKGDVTDEVTFSGRSGHKVVLQRYGKNDYAVWVTDDPTNELSGCSTRGTFLQILDEIRDELPAKKWDNEAQMAEVSCFVEIFDDFLDRRGIKIPNDEKDEDECASNIYGSDYAEVADLIEERLINLGVFSERGHY